MAAKGVDFFDGAMDVGGASYSTTGKEPSASSGGPIEVPDGIDKGHSFGVPDRPSNAVDLGGGKGEPISSELA
jgi:hypothetical protein